MSIEIEMTNVQIVIFYMHLANISVALNVFYKAAPVAARQLSYKVNRSDRRGFYV
jgi:hypothetical protein